MNVQRVYWLAFGWFGLMAMVNGVLDLQDDEFLGAVVTIGAGTVIAVAAAWGALHPEDSGLPDEPGLILYAGIVAAGIYTLVTFVRIF